MIDGRSMRWDPAYQAFGAKAALRAASMLPGRSLGPGQCVGAVEQARLDMDLDGHARRPQPVGIREVLLVEEVEVADPDPRRGQPGEVRAAGGHGIPAVHPFASGVTEACRPADSVCLRRPDEVATVGGTVIEGAVVEHGVEQ